MVYIVEEAVNVNVNRIIQVLYLHEPTALCYGVFRGAVRTEAVGTLMELCFTDWFKHLKNTLLYHTVNDCGNTQRSCFSVGLGNFHPLDRAGCVPTELFLNKPDELFLAKCSKVFDCPLIHAGRPTSLIALDCPVCQFDIFLTCDKVHEVLKGFAIQTVGIQTVKCALQVVILRIADFALFRFVLLLLRSQHRHPPLSVRIFFVILEAVFVVFSDFLSKLDLGLSLHGLLSPLHRYYAPTLTGIKDGYIV